MALASDYRNTTGYHVDRNDGCMVTHVSDDRTDKFWDNQYYSGNYLWGTFNNHGAYTDSSSVNNDYDINSRTLYYCDKYDYSYIDLSNVEFACGKEQLIYFLNEIAGVGFDNELKLPDDTNYFPVYTFMTCPLDGLLARMKINYYGFWCDYDNKYVITGVRYQTRCSGFGYEEPDPFGSLGWYTGWEFGYGGGNDYPHNHCYGHPNEYTISYNANGGSGTISDQSCSYDSSSNLSNGGFSRSGWQQTGWKNRETNQTYSLGQSIINLTAEQGKVITMDAIWKDIAPPVISAQDVYGWTNQNVTISPTAVDHESGMNRLELYDGTTLLTSGQSSLKYAFSTEQEKTYKLKAIDNAGNVSYKDFKVRIDKTPPDITINGTKNSDVKYGWTNGSIQITTNFNEALSGIQKVNIADTSGNIVKEISYTNEATWVKNIRTNYIVKCYETIYKYEPKPEEVAFWYGYTVTAGDKDAGYTTLGLLLDQHFTNTMTNAFSDSDYVYLLYNMILNRNPDPGGYNAYMSYICGGVNRFQAAVNMYYGEEATTLRNAHYGVPTAETYTQSPNTAVLDYTVTKEGSTNWIVTAIDGAGNQRQQTITTMINSSGVKVNLPDYGWTNKDVYMIPSVTNSQPIETNGWFYNVVTGAQIDTWNCSGSKQVLVKAIKANEGITHWRFTATDVAGNTATIANTVKIDITNPTIVAADIKPSYNSSGQMTEINVTARDTLSGINTIGLYDSNNKLLYQINGNGSAASQLVYPFPNYNYADYYYVIVKDVAGNSYQQTICAKYTVDYYLMDLDKISYSLSDTEIYLGIPGTACTAALKDYPGFNKPDPQIITLNALGTSLIEYYYSLGEVTVKFNANGGTGTMPDLVNYSPTVTLPTHTFKKENTAGQSKFLGWNEDKNAKTATYKENGQLTFESGKSVITLYAIWDDCPEIVAQDRYYTLDDAIKGLITQADLLTTVTVTDDHDTTFTQSLKVVDYNPFEFKQFTTEGTSLIKYQVTDSAGNISTTTATVYIVDTTPVVIQENSYTRFISEKYYQNSYEEGGLEENSIWKTDPDYAAVLENAMENRRSLTYEKGSVKLMGIDYDYVKPGSISQDHIYETWTFTPEDITRVKEYIDTHGFGKFKEDSALVNFRTEFMSCKN